MRVQKRGDKIEQFDENKIRRCLVLAADACGQRIEGWEKYARRAGLEVDGQNNRNYV